MVDSTIQLDQLYLDPPPGKSRGGCGSCGSGKAVDGLARCGNGLEKIYPTTAVRFGYMKYIGECSHAPDMKFTCGAKVIIQTKRGIEFGEQVSQTCHGCDKSVTRDEMRAWVDACGQDSFIFEAGRILREATAADLAEYAHIQAENRQKRNFCQDLADRHRLPMQAVECETLFGGERIIFYFLSEERIDFREVVKELAHEYRTRIEMRQVGARDEARLLADYETCGREVCCKVFLKTLRPISMRMAKLQKATLDPSQVSGRCGRLKCCLRYEHVAYEELDKQLPRNGLRIRTNHGEGVVVNRQILTQLVQIRKDDGAMITVVAEDSTGVGVSPPPPEALPPPGGVDDRPGRGSSRERPPREGGRPSKPRRDPQAGPRRHLRDEAMPEGEAGEDSLGEDPRGSSDDPGQKPGSPIDDRPKRVEGAPDEAQRRRRRGRRRPGRGPGGGHRGPESPPPP